MAISAEFRGPRRYVAWRTKPKGRLNLLSAGDALIANASASFPQLSSMSVDCLRDGSGAMYGRFLENAASSLFILVVAVGDETSGGHDVALVLDQRTRPSEAGLDTIQDATQYGALDHCYGTRVCDRDAAGNPVFGSNPTDVHP